MSGVTLDELLKEVGVTSMQLDEKCTNEHLLEIALFLTSWRTLAPHLGLSSEMEAVDRDAHSEKEKSQKILKSWKAKFSFKATYRVLVEALLKIGSADLAEQVCRLLVSQQPKSNSQESNVESHYRPESDATHTRPNGQSSNTSQPASEKAPFGCECGNCTFFSLIERGCPKPIPSASSFPYLDLTRLTHDQQQELRGRLRFESQDIMMQFQKLVSSTILSIKEQQIPLSDLKSHIMTLGAFDPVYKKTQVPAFHHHFEDLETADTVSKVFLVLKDYFSFFNYHVIEHIITMLGTEKDKFNLKHYKDKFDQYAKRRIYECMPQFGPTSEADHADVFVKVDSQYENFTVTEVERFRCQLSELLHVSPQGVLRLGRIERGCFQLTFQVPLFVQQEIFPLSREQERSLKLKGVIRLTCCEYQFLAEETEDDVVLQAASFVKEGEFELHTKPMDTEDPSEASRERISVGIQVKPMPSESRRAKASGIADRITNYCCFLQSMDAGTHGSGFIVELNNLQSANLLALNWKKRGKTGEFQTDYALVTSHDTIPGLSLSNLELNRWTVSCQGINNGYEQTLGDLVCGVISCCGPESLLAGHTADATVTVFHPHPAKASCSIQLNIAILFLNKSFEELLQGSTVFPPVIPVNEYLDQNTYTQKHQLIIDTGRNSRVSYCDGIQSVKTASFSIVEQQRTSEHEQVLAQEIIEFEKFQKLESNTTMEICHGSPVYLNPDANEPLMIGVYVGRTRQRGEQLVITFHGILRLLQGGLIPVLSVLQCLDIPKAWTGRWGYLVTPHIDQMERMECSYVCEVLHFLLRKRHGTPLVKLPVDLVDKDNEASLDLLCALFKHLESADNAELNEAVTKLNLENEINAYIARLCKDVIHLLESGDILVADRTTFVEKCLIFYNRLLDFKYAGITAQILHTPQNFELLKHIQQRYKHSYVVKKNVIDIILKRHQLSGKELLARKDETLPEDVIDSLQQIGLDLKTTGDAQTTIKEVQSLLHSLEQHETASKLLDLALENQSHEPYQQALENQPHYEAYQKALKEGVAIPLKYLKLLFFGPPRTGKTSMRRRLVGEIKNIKLANEFVQASTGTAEHYDVIVKLVEDKTTTSTSVITKSEWSSVKTLFGQQKNTHETDLDDELRLLFQFIYEADPTTQRKSPVSKPVKKEAETTILDEASKGQNPAILQTDNVTGPTDSPKTIDPESSKLQEVSPEYELSNEQMKEIERAFEAFNKILRTAGQEKLKILLDGAILLNMVDTGGHPAFLEMLPALTMGPALYLIFFRLNQELKERYQIKYISENSEEVQLGDSSYTVEEVIFQALSSIACFGCTAPKKDMPNPSHAAMLIGTHKDLLKSDQETAIKDKDKALKDSLQEILETDTFELDKELLQHAREDQLMFAIDNMTGDEGELAEVHERLEDIIKQEFDNFAIPASWLMFSIFLRKMGKRTLSLSQCHQIGERLEVRDTDEALWFLHHHVGTLMHFPDVEEIKDIVICDPQVVFDSVTDLILNSFNLKRVRKSVCDKFKETGQFRIKDIQNIAQKLSSDNLPLHKLVKLLEYLNIIAPNKPECSVHSLSTSLPLSPESSPHSDAHQEQNLVYFMPTVLKHAKEEELYVEHSPTDPVPLMIHFKCGFVPVGVFCAMIASLVGQRDILGWILQEPRDGHNLCKNKVTFRINGAFNITLISKPKRYEIHIARISTTDRALEEICQHVLKTICDILDQVISKMKYKQLVSSRSDQTLYELGFKCPKHPNDDHLVINKPKGGVKSQPSQSAMSLWSNYIAIERGSTMICLKKRISINLRDTRLFPSFAQQSLVWFGEATKISSALPDMLPAKDASHDVHVQSHGLKGDQELPLPKELDVKNIVNVLHEVKFADGDWAQLGLQLIDHFDSTTIRADHDRASDCMSNTISQWLKSDTKASWEKLAEAVSKVAGYGEATAASVREKAGIAHTAGLQKVEVKHQNLQTEAVEIKHQQVQTETIITQEKEVFGESVIKKEMSNDDKPGSSNKVKHQNVQTEAVEIKDQHVQAKAIPKEKTHIRGTEVIAQKTFILTQEEVDLNFEGYGFKLHVPENSLPAKVSETKLNVRVSLSGPFQIPPNSELLSAVYWISTPHKFAKPITVEIQHCAALSSDEQCSKLTFVHTKCTQKNLPYTFEKLVGGVFSAHSLYGSLSLSHFSGLGVVGQQTLEPERPPEQQSSAHIGAASQTGQETGQVVEQYCAQLFNSRLLVNEWKVIFVVTKDLDSCSTVVKNEYSSHAHQQFSFNIGFKNEFVSLNIPQKGLELGEWKITPFYNPIITRQQVNLFDSGKNIPKCELVLEWSQDTPPALLHHSIDLLGAGDHDYFLLHVNPGTASESAFMAPTLERNHPTAEENRPQVELTTDDLFEVTNYLLDFGQPDIYNLGLTLGLNYPRLTEMEGSMTFRDNMIAAWLKKEDQVTKRGRPTWETLVNALRHPRVNQIGTAEKIEKDILSKQGQTLSTSTNSK